MVPVEASKIELRFHIAVVVHDNGVFAAGLDGHRAAGACKRLRVGIQLIVRNIGHRVSWKELVKQSWSITGHTPSKVILRRDSQNVNGAVADIAHARGNGDFGKRAAVAKVQGG